MTKEPADWAKIKAYRATYRVIEESDADILGHCHDLHSAIHELARMYDKYEQPPVDPDLLAAREWVRVEHRERGFQLYAEVDGTPECRAFLAGIKHGRANP